MRGFTPPTREMVLEMVENNVVRNHTPLDFSSIPRSVLEKIVHHGALTSLLGEPPPKIGISVGPDEEYHHEIQGVASISPESANIFYRHGEDWYSITLDGGEGIFELVGLKLKDDTTDDWEILDFEDEQEAEIIQMLSLDSLQYLGLLPGA